MKFKKLIVFVLMLVVGLVLTGCGGGGKKKAFKMPTAEEFQAAQAEGITVKFRVQFGDTIKATIREMIASFNETYPKITVELEELNGDYNLLLQKNDQDLGSAKYCPTLSVGYPDHIAQYLIKDGLQSFTPFIESKEYGWDQAVMDDFIQGYLNENRQFDAEGSFYGLPFNKSTEVMYYNASFFNEEEGFAVTYNTLFGYTEGSDQYLDPAKVKVPKTWEEMKLLPGVIIPKLEELAAKIKELKQAQEADPSVKVPNIPWLGGDKLVENILGDANGKKRFMTAMYDSMGNAFTTIIHQYGGKYTESLKRANGATDVQRGVVSFVEDPVAAEAIHAFKQIANAEAIQAPEIWDQSYASGPFGLGQVLLNVGSTGGVSHYNDAKCEVKATTMPYFESKNIKTAIQQGTNLVMFKNAKPAEKLAAWLFVKHCLEPENTAHFGMKTGYLPVRKSAYQLPQYQEFLTNPKATQKNQAMIHNAIQGYNEGWEYFVDPAWAGSSRLRQAAQTRLRAILVSLPSGITIEEIQKEFKKIKQDSAQ